jgi:hypothetical protein
MGRRRAAPAAGAERSFVAVGEAADQVMHLSGEGVVLFIARHVDPPLGDHEDGVPDPVPVADADGVVAQSVDGEVLPELPTFDIDSAEELPPVVIGIGLVDEHGACSPPWPPRSPCPSSSMLSLRTICGPVTGYFQTAVNTVPSFQGTFFGSPTLTESKVGTPSIVVQFGAADTGLSEPHLRLLSAHPERAPWHTTTTRTRRL